MVAGPTCGSVHLAMAEARLATATVLLNGEIVDANKAFAELLGEASPQQVLLRNLSDWFVSPEEFEQFVRTSSQEVVQFEFTLRTGNEELRTFAVSARLLTPDQSEVPARELALVDVTERRNLQLQLQQSQKMQALGRLAGGVAHDFNNLLMVIRGTCELMLLRHHLDDALTGRVQVISKATEQGAQLTRQLLAFSRRQVMQPKLIDVNAHLRDLESMLEHLIGEDIEIRQELSDERLCTVIDGGQLHQVLLNIAVNARDAMPDGGTLLLRSSRCVVTAGNSSEHAPVPCGDYVLVSISDSGTGMDPETLQHIFEPFYTTKGYGTGLGLSTVYGILQQSHGSIRVESELGKGTTFYIYLPSQSRDEQKARAVKPEGASSPMRATILLVEDEKLVRDGAAEFLTISGFEVFTASDGIEGLAVAEAHPEIDLVITDIVMPRMRGIELAFELRRRRPEIPILFTSGYADLPLELSSITHSDVLHKPFSLSEISRRVGALLAHEGSGAQPAKIEATQ